MPDSSPSRVNLTISDLSVVGPVLERLVSAAAVRADLPVDRVINAMTVVDAFVAASDAALENTGSRNWSLSIAPGEVQLALDGLIDGQAEAVRAAAVVPNVGDVLAYTTHAVEIVENDAGSSLVVKIG